MSQILDNVLLIGVKDAAKRLSVSRRTLEREVARGKFPRPLKVGRKTVVAVSDLEEYVRRLRLERGGAAGSEVRHDSHAT